MKDTNSTTEEYPMSATKDRMTMSSATCDGEIETSRGKRALDKTLEPTVPATIVTETVEDDESESFRVLDPCPLTFKKRKLSRASSGLAEKHYLKIRSLIEAGDKWEYDLEQVHGLTYAQASLCISIAAEHFHSESFPPADGNLFLELAREGWEHLKELDRLSKLYQECA